MNQFAFHYFTITVLQSLHPSSAALKQLLLLNHIRFAGHFHHIIGLNFAFSNDSGNSFADLFAISSFTDVFKHHDG